MADASMNHIKNLNKNYSKRLNKKTKRYFKDSDKDGVPDLWDCEPYNSKRDVWYDPRTWFKPKEPAPTVTVAPTTTIITPTGEKITATETPTGGIVVTSTTGQTKTVPVTTSGGITIQAPVIPVPGIVKEEEKIIKVEPSKLTPAQLEAQKLGLGVPVVSAYAPLTVVEVAKPFTKEEIKKAEKLRYEAAPLAYIKEKIKPPLEKAKEKVTAALQKIYYAYKPEEKVAKERITEVYTNYESGVELHNKDVKTYEKKIGKFEEKYIGRELSPEEYDIAIREQDALKAEARELDESEKFWNEFKEKIKDVEEREMLKAKAISAPRKVLTSFSIGVMGMALGVTPAAFALTAVTEPSSIIKGLYYETPKAIIERPLETIPEMIGGAVVITGAVGIIKSAVSKAGVMKVKPAISQSFSVSEATKVGKTPDGASIWKTEGTITTKLKNPQTGKTISTIKTQTISDTITSKTKAGAMKAFTESWATSLKTSDIKLITGKTPTVKLKVSLTKAKGTMTLSPTEVEKLYTGYGGYGIREMGKIEVVGVPKKVVTKIKLKVGKEFEALSNIWVKEIGAGKAIKGIITPKKALAIRGKEYKYMYQSLTDIYGKKGAEAIIKAREVGYAKAFVPEELIVKFKEPFKPPIVKPKLPLKPAIIKPAIKPTDMTTQLQQVFGLPEEAVAKISAAQVSKAIAKTITGEPKPIIVPKVIKVSPAVKLISLISPAAVVVTKMQLKEREAQIQRLNQALGIEQITGEKKLQIQRIAVTPIQTQRLQQRQMQIQMQKLSQITAPIVPTPIPIIPAPAPTIIPTFGFRIKETPQQRRIRKEEERKAKAQVREYQASVAAFSLGIYAPRKKLPKRLTGLEIRPIEATAYNKRLNKIFA